MLERKRTLELSEFKRCLCLSLQAVVVLTVIACTSCGKKAPEWKQALKYEPHTGNEEASQPQSSTTDELVIYLDTSASMAGYVSANGQSIFGKTLRELRYATGTFGNSNAKVLVRRIAADVGPALSDMELTTASQDQGVYRGGETNLAGAISKFALPSQAEAKSSGERDAVKASLSDNAENKPIPRFHILVTDGVQSTRQGSATHDCTAGSDQFCVRQKIGELLNQGWGGCVLGIRADFRGKVYSEVSKGSISYETRSENPTTFRPFYLYIFSPDRHALDSLVNSLKERLRPLVSNSEPIRELNLSFPYMSGATDFDVLVDKDARSFIARNKDRGGPPSRITIEVDVDTEKSGPKPFSVVAKLPWSAHALDTASEAELAQLLNWNVDPIYPPENETAGKRFPEIKILRTHVDSPGQVTVDVTAQFPRGSEDPCWRVYVLKAKLNLTQTTTPSWIRDWSVDLDTTRDAGNRTFNLETALLGLWNTSKMKDQIVAKAHIRIGPK
ncbi:MAG TPA: hypothetical protein VGD61_20710 [Pyrinomonadaceae bacterium]